MAISFDAGTGAFRSSSGGVLTYSHTCTGSNGILFVTASSLNIVGAGSDQISSVLYGANTMTLVDKVVTFAGSPANAIETYLYYLINPATGSNTVTVSPALPAAIWAASASYSGAQQSGVPDATNKSGSGIIDASVQVATTTVADNDWVVMGSFSGSGSVAAGANTTIRAASSVINGGSFQDRAVMSDNGGPATPAGTVTLTITAFNDREGAITAAFAPSGGAAAAVNNLTVLGLGT